MEQGFGGLNRSPVVASAAWAAFGGTVGARPCSWALPCISEEGAVSLACVALSALPGERPTVLFPEPVRIPPLPLPQCGWLPSAGCLRRCSLPGRRGRRSRAAPRPPLLLRLREHRRWTSRCRQPGTAPVRAGRGTFSSGD